MSEWIKKHSGFLITVLVTVGTLVFLYGCPPKTQSLVASNKLVNRQELQLELDQLIGLAQLRMTDLDKQEELRAVILQNALILVQGQPFNPLGLLTGVAAIYGIAQGGSNIGKIVKGKVNGRKHNNSTV